MINVTKYVTGPLETNTYLVDNGNGHCLIIDPSSGCDDLIAAVGKESLVPEAILLTHAHFDHMMGIPEIEAAFGDLTVYVHPADAPYLSNPELNGSIFLGEKYDFAGVTHRLVEGEVTIGSFTLTVLHLPGHTPGGCAFCFPSCCFCGDALFAGSIGRSDLPGGDGKLLVDSIRKKLLTLSENTVLYPGHMGRTTVAREKRSNPFLV